MADLRDSVVVFKQVDDAGNVTGFDAMMLVQYILSSGNTTNPLTRKEFALPEIGRLQRMLHGVGVDSKLRTLLPHVKRLRRDRIENQSMMDFLENELGAAITAAIDSAEINASFDYDTAQEAIVAQTYPLLSSIMFRLFRFNASSVRSVKARMRSIIRTHRKLRRYDYQLLRLLVNCLENAYVMQRATT
tara:strand:+ start:1613 stop:2179 length:567 start_codon:yes stop_codon:yes gene_type:complete